MSSNEAAKHFLPTEGFDVSLTGFEAAEIDSLLSDMASSRTEPEDILPALPANPTTRRGDTWHLKKHKLLCGDARDPGDFARLMNGALAAAVFCDPPYNLRVSRIGGRGRVQHPEFAFASGEMSPPQYREFLHKTLGNGVRASSPTQESRCQERFSEGMAFDRRRMAPTRTVRVTLSAASRKRATSSVSISTGRLAIDNVFDHNGWNASIAGADATIFNRTAYLSTGDGTTIYSGNIGAEGSSGGVQQRTGGTTNDNLFLRSPIAITGGSVQNEEPPFNGTEHRSI